MTGKSVSFKYLVSFALVFLIMNGWPLYAANEISPGTTLPKFKMKTPDNPEFNNYLGIQDSKKFSLSDISAKLTVVEFFSVFCPVCHAQAPKANQLYRLIEGDQELKQDIKMIAIGLGNKPDQMATYQKKFNVSFPLMPDPYNDINKAVKIRAIPQTLIVDKNGKVLASHLGVINDLDAFLREIRDYHKQQ